MRAKLVLEADHEALRQLRPWLDGTVGMLSADLIGVVELAVHELAANIVDHGEGQRLVIELERIERTLRFELRDNGSPVQLPSEADLEPHPRVHGYGMVIVRQLASRVHYERSGAENVWSIDFEIDPELESG